MPVSVASNCGSIPGTALLLASFKVIVMVDVAIPSAVTVEVPAMVELAEVGSNAENSTGVDPGTAVGEVH